MEALKNAILEKGQVVGEDILKVDTFLNHQLDASLLNEIGKEFKRRFEGQDITKILTIEASGIAIAIIAAQYFNVPVVLLKRSHQKILMTALMRRMSFPLQRQRTTRFVCQRSLLVQLTRFWF